MQTFQEKDFYAVLLLAFYFLPGLIASMRRHANRTAIGALNLLLGWTVLGWIGALVWSLTANVDTRSPQITTRNRRTRTRDERLPEYEMSARDHRSDDWDARHMK